MLFNCALIIQYDIGLTDVRLLLGYIEPTFFVKTVAANKEKKKSSGLDKIAWVFQWKKKVYSS